jgi:hypothetical protein
MSEFGQGTEVEREEISTDTTSYTAPPPPRKDNANRNLIIGVGTGLALLLIVTMIVVVTTKSSDAPAAATPTSSSATSTAKLDGTQEYGDIVEMRKDLDARGLECVGLKEDTRPAIAAAQGRCDIAGHETVLQIWDSAHDRDEGTSAMITETFLRAGLNYCLVLGRGSGSWSINASDDRSLCTRVATALGGEVFDDYTVADAAPPSSSVAAPPATGGVMETAFLGVVHDQGLNRHGSDADLISLAHSACAALSAGVSLERVQEITVEGGWSTTDAESFIALAVGAYCIENGDKLD